MAEDTQNTDTQAEGLAALGAISADAPVSEAPAAPAEPKIDNLGGIRKRI
jgi:hypothetical protein